MTDLARMEAALQAASDAGDVEAAKEIAVGIRQHLQLSNPSLGMPDPVKLGQEGMPAAIKMQAGGANKPSQVFGGMGSAPVLGLEGLKGLFNVADRATVQNWKALRDATPLTRVGGMAGDAGLFGVLPARAMQLGARMAGMELPAMLSGRAAGVADTGITAGGTNYALTPGEMKDRALPALMAAPLAAIAPGLYGAMSGVGRKTTSGGRQANVGEGVLQEIGPRADEFLYSLQGNNPFQSLGIQTSAAMKTGDPTLQVLESGSRAKNADLWKPFDQRNARSRWDTLLAKAGTPEELEGMKTALNRETGSLRDQALSDAQLSTIFSQSGDVTKQMLQPITSKIADWRMRYRPNPDVQALGNYLEGQLKQGVTPEQLYEVRKVLTDGIKAGRTDELSNAIKAARVQRVEAVKMIDDTLNTLSGGGWGEYLGKHSAGMRPIESKQALQDIVGSMKRGMPEGVVPPVMGEAAGWKTVGNLRDRFGNKGLGSKTVDTLLPEDRELVNTIADSLKRQADAMTAKATLGSPTAPLIANAGRSEAVTRSVVENGANAVLPFGGSILTSKVFDGLGRPAEQELARLLQDPHALAEALVAAMSARRRQALSSQVGAGVGAAGASAYVGR